MVNRKKRLERGIESLENQIIIHKEKLIKAEKERNNELVNYYIKEIEKFRDNKKKKEKILKKN